MSGVKFSLAMLMVAAPLAMVLVVALLVMARDHDVSDSTAWWMVVMFTVMIMSVAWGIRLLVI